MIIRVLPVTAGRSLLMPWDTELERIGIYTDAGHQDRL